MTLCACAYYYSTKVANLRMTDFVLNTLQPIKKNNITYMLIRQELIKL